MAKTHPEIDQEMAAWVGRQHLFFVATAPLAGDGLVNCSPKGLDSFAILDAHTIAYLDFNGSGVETIAHVRENGRITIMFCALDGSPKILRFQGIGHVIEPHEEEFAALRVKFPDAPAVRSIVRVDVTRVSDSCGFGVPLYQYMGERDTLARWAASKGEEGMATYQGQKNRVSLDGLPGLQYIAAAEQ